MTSTDRPKVFVIGLNKTATTSIHRAFQTSGYVSRHCTYAPNRFIAKLMNNNVMARRPILSGIGPFDALSDLTYYDETQAIEAAWYFRELHAEYPNSYFLLNFRDRDSWIESRLNHAGLFRGKTLIERAMLAYGADVEDVKSIWSDLHEKFHREVRDYFTLHTAKFLDYDIINDAPEKIVNGLAGDYILGDHVWTHAARSVSGGRKRSAIRKQLSHVKWSLIERLKY